MAAVPPLPKSFEDAARRHLAVQEELERVCASSHFRTSKRSCEFLQYIVRVTLDGRIDSLKERSIGIDLFGRDASYDPSSDATVRVRANEVRKRLASHYAASTAAGEIRIDLPIGSYLPHFLPGKPTPVPAPTLLVPPQKAYADIPPITVLTLMRPALVGLLICTLLLRHALENREEYLRFWDRLLAGRSAMLLAVSPQDRVKLASSLYPLVWVAGRYGIDTAMEGDSLTGTAHESLSSVQVSYATPPAIAGDGRLRWSFASIAPLETPSLVLQDRQAPTRSALASAALLTIVPEDAATLQIQGTDAEAIRQILESLTSERRFPGGLVNHLDSHHTFQFLLYRDSAGQWQSELFAGVA